MVNMLIAIMGDSFDKVTDSRPIYAMLTKLQIMGEQAPFFANHSGIKYGQKVFMVVI